MVFNFWKCLFDVYYKNKVEFVGEIGCVVVRVFVMISFVVVEKGFFSVEGGVDGFFVVNIFLIMVYDGDVVKF